MNQFEKALWESQDIQRQRMLDSSFESNNFERELTRRESIENFRESANTLENIAGDIF